MVPFRGPSPPVRVPGCLLTLPLLPPLYLTEQKEVEDMIWEVDENLDGMVDWDEFKLMFKVRVRDEKPSR